LHLNIRKRAVAAICFFAATQGAIADSYSENLTGLTSVVINNPLTRNGYWFEIKNAFGEWEKLMLVFGYYGPGDEMACKKLLHVFSIDLPNTDFRCNSVN